MEKNCVQLTAHLWGIECLVAEDFRGKIVFCTAESLNIGTTLTSKNSIQEEIKSRLKLGNACYYSVQNLFVFQFAIQKVKDQDIRV